MKKNTKRVNLPPGVAKAWRLETRGSRGPKPALSLDKVVNAAVSLADAEGASAISMNRVAQRLGVSAMALYRYVASKEELCALAVDAASAAPAQRFTEGQSWRDRVVRWSRDMLDAYRRHPWLVDIPIGTVPLMPNGLTWLEHLLRALSHAPLTSAEKLNCAILVGGYVRSVAATDRDLRKQTLLESTDSAAVQRVLAPLLDPADYREVRALFNAGEYDVDSSHYHAEDIDFGLQRILDGIQALIDMRSRGTQKKKART